MKPPSDEHALTRWIDGEMDENERKKFEERLERDSILAQEAEKLRTLSSSIRAHLPAEMDVPHADFFNSQIEIRIAQMDLEQSRTRPPEISWRSIFQWIPSSWIIPVSAVALAVFAGVQLWPSSKTTAESIILSSYTPDTRVQARSFHDAEAEATVLLLDGLDAVPSAKKISGINVHRSEIEPEMASTSLYDAHNARMLMISADAVGRPLISPRG